MKIWPVGLTFDDVLLIPQYSEIYSRKDVDTSSRLTNKIKLLTPIISANMDSVTESDMAKAMACCGGLGIIHRFLTIEKQIKEVKLVKKSKLNLLVGAAVGVKEEDYARAIELYKAGADILVVDVAHGFHKRALDMVKWIRDNIGNDVQIIGGNVATADAADALINSGADCIKVGVGPGKNCLTRTIAGSGFPQLSAIMNVSVVCEEYGIPLIADGGIKNSGDVAKAIAAGANTVMIGNLLAGTEESPGEFIFDGGSVYKVYRGMASREAMVAKQLIEGKPIEITQAPEGKTSKVPYCGKVSNVINDLVSGLKSAMSYAGARTIEEFQENAEFVQITVAGMKESKL